jgi:hypothetical protein
MEILREEYAFGRLADAEENYRDIPKRACQFLETRRCQIIGIAEEALDYRMKDKCRRDGILFGIVLKARDISRQAGIRGSTIIWSSSRLLKEVDEIFRSELGHPDAVVSTAALGCLLTLTPGVQMGLGTLRGVLFDSGLAARLTPLQRYAYRLISASEQFDLPWSKRVTLQKELGERLLADARARGEPLQEIRKRVLKSDNPEYSVKILVDTLDEMAVTPKIGKELAKARQEVKRLERELEQLKRIR